MTRLLTLAALLAVAVTAFAPMAEAQRGVRYPESTGDPRLDQMNAQIQQLNQQLQRTQQDVKTLEQALNAAIQCGTQGKVYNGRGCQDPAAVAGAGAAPGLPGAPATPPAGVRPGSRLPF